MTDAGPASSGYGPRGVPCSRVWRKHQKDGVTSADRRAVKDCEYIEEEEREIHSLDRLRRRCRRHPLVLGPTDCRERREDIARACRTFFRMTASSRYSVDRDR